MTEKREMMFFPYANRLTVSGSGEIEGAVEFCIKGLSDPEEAGQVYEDTFVTIFVRSNIGSNQHAWSIGEGIAKNILVDRLRELLNKLENNT